MDRCIFDWLRFSQIAQPWITLLVTAVFSVFGIWIAYQQLKINRAQELNVRNKNRLDLYERRFQIYQSAIKFLKILSDEAPAPPPESIVQFQLETDQAVFLFRNDVVEYLHKLADQASSWVHTYQDFMEGSPVSASSSADTDAIDPDTWLFEQLTELRKKFSPYLSFDLLKG